MEKVPVLLLHVHTKWLVFLFVKITFGVDVFSFVVAVENSSVADVVRSGNFGVTEHWGAYAVSC